MSVVTADVDARRRQRRPSLSRWSRPPPTTKRLRARVPRREVMTTRQPIGVAVVGAGYWGPNLVRNFAGHARPAPAPPVRPRRGPGPPVLGELLDGRGDDVAGHGARRPATSTPSPSPPRRHAPRRRPGRARGRQARAGGEAARADSARRAASWSPAADERGLVLMLDHTYCYTPAVAHLRALMRRASSATCSTSTRCGSTSGSCSATSTCCGTSPRTTCRSSTRPARRRRTRSPCPRTGRTRSAPGTPASRT